MTGVCAGTWLPCMATINRWFIRKRGTAMAIAGEGSPLGSLLLVPLLAWAVTPGHLGWSVTALWTGIIFLVVAWPMSRSVRDRPADYGQHPDGIPPSNLPDGQRAFDGTLDRSRLESDHLDFTARQAIRTRAFWLITFGHAFSSMLGATMVVHLVPMLTDQGLSLQMAAYVWAISLGVQAVFGLVGGHLGDRFPKNRVLFGFTGLQAVGFTYAAFVHSVPMAIWAMVIFGVGHGGRVPLTTAIRGDYFGMRAFATITGISLVANSVLQLAAPLLAAIMFDARGDYTLAFLVLGSLGSMSGVCFLFAKKPLSIGSSP